MILMASNIQERLSQWLLSPCEPPEGPKSVLETQTSPFLGPGESIWDEAQESLKTFCLDDFFFSA